MCNPSSDWAIRIQPLVQVMFFVQPLAHEHFSCILCYFSGNIKIRLDYDINKPYQFILINKAIRLE